MSTSEIEQAGLPDVDTLTRMANALFSARPPGPAAPWLSEAAPVVAPSAAQAPNVAQAPYVAQAPQAPVALLSPAVPPPVFQPAPLGQAQSPGTTHFASRPYLTEPQVRQPYGAVAGIEPPLPPEADLATLLGAAPARLAAPQRSGADSPFYFLDYSSAGRTHHAAAATGVGFDVERYRRDFPILREQVNGRRLVWLDNAATTQKPQSVIDRIAYFYQHENSNIHRAAHELAARATDAYEGAREKVRHFLNAASPNEIVFTRGATEAINLVAQSWGRQHIVAGDEIIVSWLEHHANIVPWQQLCKEKGAILKVIPVDDDGQVILSEYARLLGPRTRLVSFTQVSNALGTITPACQIVAMAHAAGARVLVDGAQAVSHLRADVQSLDCDWYVFSGHKVFGPTGIGVLYGKEALLNATKPWQGGGNMIKDVRFEHTEYHDAPSRFEAGTGNIADAVGLGAALDYVGAIGIERINAYEHALLEYATDRIRGIPGLRLIGTAADKASVLSFVLEGFKTEEVGGALNKEGIAVRSGHHCAQPILRRFGVEGTVRPSLAFYNTRAEVDLLVDTVRQLQRNGLR